MMIDLSFLHTNTVESFVWAMTHSLWQGVLISIALAATLRILPAQRSRQRYIASLTALTAIVLSVLVTWALQNYTSAVTHSQLPVTAQVAHTAEHTEFSNWESSRESFTTSQNSIPVFTSDLAPSTAMTLRSLVPYLATLWCLGAVTMLLRGFWQFGNAQSLVRFSQPAPSEWALRLETLRTQLGIHFDIGVRISETIGSPMVIGAWKPVVLLPLALASGLTTAEMDAIFAHELAHIQRRDYLINAFQILIESLLFFNPAMWWISRQVRAEREACCDAIGATLGRGQIHFAEVLANVAARAFPAHQPEPVVAMTGPEPSSLVDRVKRLVEPKYQPGMRLPWPTCIFLLFVCSAALFVTFQATQVVVAVAAEVMSDEERVAVLTEEATEIPSEVDPKFDKVTISGTISFPVDFKIPDHVDLSVSCKSNRNSSGSSNLIKNPSKGSFSIETASGQSVHIIAHVPGLAPAHLGPFTSNDGPEITGQEIHFEYGVDLPFEVVDDEGEPAQDVLVHAIAHGGVMGTYTGKVTTDESGSGQFEHMTSKTPFAFSLSGSGYQPKRIRPARIDVSQPLKLTISRAQPSSGIVMDENGKPLPGVEIREFFDTGVGPQSGTRDHSLEFKLLTETNASGQFTLTSLRDDQLVYAILKHPDYAPTLLPKVIPGEKNLSVTMQKGVRVSGEIRGIEKLTRFQYQFPVPIPNSPWDYRESFGYRNYAKVINDNGTMKFDLGRILPGKLHLSIGHQWLPFEITEDRDDLIVDYSAQDKMKQEVEFRDVVIRFHDHGEPVKPTGHLEVYTSNSQVNYEQTRHLAEVRDGEIRVPAPLPSKFAIHNQDGLIGYWFHARDVERFDIEAGDGPVEVDIPVYPAGAVKGRVIDEKGHPAVGYRMTAHYEFKASDKNSYSNRGFYHSSAVDVKTNAAGEFFLTPVPIGAKCRVSVGDGFYRDISSEFEILDTKPLVTKDFQMGQRSSLEVSVVGPDGSPLPRVPVKLSFRKFKNGMSWGPPPVTDARGQVRFEGLNLGPQTQYFAAAEPIDTYVPTRIRIGPDLPNRIQLAKGLTVQGRVLDMNGNPVPGVKVRAMPQDSMRDLGLEGWEAVPNYVSKEKTDKHGRFVISQLPAIPLRLTSDGVHADNFFEFDPTIESELVYRGRVAEWFRERMDAKK